jgi:hypothetical protein
MTRHREEVVNVYLAECLRDMGVQAKGEQIEFRGGRRAMPDVMFGYMGLRCMIEGKFADHSNARSEVFENASNRVANGIAHIAIGVVYPASVRSVDAEQIKDALQSEQMDFCICTENDFLKPEWGSGSASEIMAALRRSHEELLKSDVVERSVARLRAGMYGLVFVIKDIPAVAERTADLLGVYQPSKDVEEEDEDE